ncbi:MAG: SOS response-associated peptidase [Mariniblastus sp.]
MCGRITLRSPANSLIAMFDDLRSQQLVFPKFKPRYNICPTQSAIAVRESDSGEYEVAELRWGLVPFWSKDLKIGARMINARSETVATKPAFRVAFKSRRCLILADGFYEWKKEGKSKQPFYISRTDDQPFCMAGLWESWTDKENPNAAPVESCTVLTTDANTIMQPLHDRMPVILEQQQFDFWLDKEFTDRETLEAALVPYASDELQTFPVDTIVNKASNDSPECIERLRE